VIVIIKINLNFSSSFSLFIFQSGLLGVFQKLIASKVNDHEGFYLLQYLVEHFPE
jgi:hypothetical protein